MTLFDTPARRPGVKLPLVAATTSIPSLAGYTVYLPSPCNRRR